MSDCIINWISFLRTCSGRNGMFKWYYLQIIYVKLMYYVDVIIIRLFFFVKCKIFWQLFKIYDCYKSWLIFCFMYNCSFSFVFSHQFLGNVPKILMMYIFASVLCSSNTNITQLYMKTFTNKSWSIIYLKILNAFAYLCLWNFKW